MNNTWWWVPLLLPALVSAQQDSTWGPNMQKGNRINLEGIGAYDSNVLYNDLITSLYKGGVLAPEVRQRSMDALGNVNRAGYEFGSRATFAWGDSLFGHRSWMPRFSLSYQSAMGLRFAPDAYSLSFFGNSGFEDRTAHVGQSYLRQVNYQTFSFGLEDRETGSFVELSLVNGSRLNTCNLPLADLYSAPDGRYLDLVLEGDYRSSDTASSGFNKGIGAAINVEWRHPLKLFGSPAVFSASITDVGFISWNRNSLAVTKDTTLHYQGIEVTDLLDLDGILVNNSTLQDSLGLGYSTGSFTMALPARVQARIKFGNLRNTGPGNNRHAYTLSADYRYLPGYVPRALITRDFAITECFLAQVGAGYGGFGTLRGMVGMEALLGKSLRIGLGTTNIVGLVSDQVRGKALTVQLETTW